MSDALRDPLRWKDDVEHGDVTLRAVGRAIRCARAVPPRRAPSFERVFARIRSSRSPRRLAWVVVTAAFLLGLATAASAARLDLLPSWLTGMLKAKPHLPAREQRPPRARVSSTKPATISPQAADQSPVQSSVVPSGTSATLGADGTREGREARLPTSTRKVAVIDRNQREVAAAAPGTGSRTLSEATLSPSVPEPPPIPTEVLAPKDPSSATSPTPVPGAWPLPVQAYLAAESPTRSTAIAPVAIPPSQAKKTAGQYLSETVRLLRAERLPAEALRFLDRHKGELELGGFAHEALILRAEALLAQGRRQEVLRLLDGASLTDVAASRALLVTRGQLRAEANRCGDGIGDFDLVLARSRQTDRQALVGRALCRKRLGDGLGSKADVQRLLGEFPGQPLPAELAK
jgi:hypothetical protein